MTHRPLVSPDVLAGRLGAPDLRVVDASWHLPAAGRDAAAEFAEARVPGAGRFDIDAHAAASPLPHMLPGAAAFAEAAGALGIAADDDIVVYDTIGLFSAARVRWMFRHYGARRVAILDGGLPAWRAAGLPLESGPAAPLPSTRFAASEPPAHAVASAEDVLRTVTDDGAPLVLDARSAARFTGEEPEARAGLRSGHVPGSVSLPFTELVADGRLKPNAALRDVFAAHGVPIDTPVVASCGSGVTAAVIALALECLGATDVALYDGSWAEWGGRDELPVARGVSER